MIYGWATHAYIIYEYPALPKTQLKRVMVVIAPIFLNTRGIIEGDRGSYLDRT